ncbi:hypothetical protein BY996DRAFT_6611128 [Phakopsora pachyrhizi]|uniref:Uncharacterized protein n=1 Tax=Phakopsora pachyrhizi TaxID=170000 RepID=A0AAV0AS68_PHAPC|nr:hypothetical protein BY996DRAFT_6611128 [Phakopsora pachyrhizi]CAH7671396.1 hypothetical protein PPACK8108_LOCUS6170 [Phakopsora pachyrhizi]
MPCNLSSREQLAITIGELEIEDLKESESGSGREEDILLLHDLYTKRYLAPQSSIKLSKTYSPEDLMQLSPSNFKQLNWTTHIAFGKLCDLLRGDSIFYNNSRHKQIALEIQVAKDKSNPSGHLTTDDYSIICWWLSKPSNFSACFGQAGKTTIGRPPASKENGYARMAAEVNQKSKSGLNISSKQMKERFKTYKAKYVKAKKLSASTGFGISEEDQRNGILS